MAIYYVLTIKEGDFLKRYNPDIKEGLNKKQLEERKRDKLLNYDVDVPTKTIGQIITLNIFTLFNIVNFVLAFLIICVGSYKNLLFMGGIICNTCISIFQEIRTKRIIDKLSVINTSKATVIREKKEKEIEINEIALDDIIKFKVGQQVTVDTIIKEGKCEVNESFITGEDLPVFKKKGDMILSGSFLVSGHILGRVEHIGLENYTAQISKEARYTKKVNSVLMNSLNSVIKVISMIIIPLGILMLLKQWSVSHNITLAVVNMVASVIGMIPEGLVLLTSTVLAVAVIKLSKYHVLVQQLYCIEMLARVDTLCLDKTGTITEGKIEIYDLLPKEETLSFFENILKKFSTYSEDENATMKAIQTKYSKETKKVFLKTIPFDSEKKYSGLWFEESLYLLGAPEILLKKDHNALQEVEKYAKEYRVLVLLQGKDEKEIENHHKIIGYLLMQDVIRKEAKNTIGYFKKQGVDIKVISGDHPLTVSNIAKRVGIENYQKYIDLSSVLEEDFDQIVNEYTIFGRVKPSQKKGLVQALQRQKHTVAMTGDGVNDVLALKEADCSIAMKSGSDAARNVSHLVLLDDNFDAMPKVLLEGRQTVNNIERSASLFLTKTIYASLLSIFFLFLPMSYPFEPIQLTLTSVVAIGIPSFILALEPNKNRIRGNFFSNVLVKSFPNAIVIVLDILIIMVFSSLYSLSRVETSTMCVLMNAFVSFLLLYRLCKPFTWMKKLLFVSMILIFLVEILGFPEFFSLAEFNLTIVFLLTLLVAFSMVALDYITLLFQKYFERK